MIVDERERAYFDEIQSRSTVPHKLVVHPWKDAQPRECHNNVARWVELNPTDSVCCGWLVLGSCIFVAHSVVRAPDGTLFDVTPADSEDDADRFFLEHLGNRDAFHALLPHYSTANLLWGEVDSEKLLLYSRDRFSNEL